MNKEKKKKYVKPEILHRGKLEVLAAVCNSTWNGQATCMVTGNPTCIKTQT